MAAPGDPAAPTARRLLRWPRDVWEVARQTTLLLARSKIVLLLVLASAAVAALFAVVGRFAASNDATGGEFFGVVAYLVVLMFGLPVTVLYLGVAAVHGDLHDRTATYLFVRPLHRASLLLGKWLAVVLVGWLLAAAAIAMLFAGLWISDPPWRLGLAPKPDMAAVLVVAAAMASAAYGAVGACFAAWLRRPLVAAAVFVVGWEFVASMVPPEAGVRTLTVADPVRRWLVEVLEPPPRSELYTVLMNNLDHLADPAQLGDPKATLLRFTLVLLALALWAYVRREYDSRPRD